MALDWLRTLAMIATGVGRGMQATREQEQTRQQQALQNALARGQYGMQQAQLGMQAVGLRSDLASDALKRQQLQQAIDYARSPEEQTEALKTQYLWEQGQEAQQARETAQRGLQGMLGLYGPGQVPTGEVIPRPARPAGPLMTEQPPITLSQPPGLREALGQRLAVGPPTFQPPAPMFQPPPLQPTIPAGQATYEQMLPVAGAEAAQRGWMPQFEGGYVTGFTGKQLTPAEIEKQRLEIEGLGLTNVEKQVTIEGLRIENADAKNKQELAALQNEFEKALARARLNPVILQELGRLGILGDVAQLQTAINRGVPAENVHLMVQDITPGLERLRRFEKVTPGVQISELGPGAIGLRALEQEQMTGRTQLRYGGAPGIGVPVEPFAKVSISDAQAESKRYEQELRDYIDRGYRSTPLSTLAASLYGHRRAMGQHGATLLGTTDKPQPHIQSLWDQATKKARQYGYDDYTGVGSPFVVKPAQSDRAAGIRIAP